MTDASIYYTSTAIAMAALAMISLVALRGWRDWIGLRRYELDHGGMDNGNGRHHTATDAASRIELADLRERLKKLEAIAAGVDP